jgi:hypothetical protein
VCGDAVEILGDVDRGDAQLGGLRDQTGRVGRSLVGIVCRGPQYLLGELIEGLDDHLLLIVGRQVEVVLTAGLEPSRSAAQVLCPFELPGRGAGSGEDRLRAVAQAPVERVAQMVFVQKLLADKRGKHSQGDIDPGPFVWLHPDAGLAAAPFQA